MVDMLCARAGDDADRRPPVSAAHLVNRAYDVFHSEMSASPPLTLRGANAVDSYSRPMPFDPVEDVPTDHYLEGFAFWGLGYLDAHSWRHYVPRLIDYACRHPDDPAMVIEALVRSLRPPDRYPPRLMSLSAGQEDVVRSFLEYVALSDVLSHLKAEAQQALEEWWLPHARCRPTAEDTAALRAAPINYRVVIGDVYRLALPDTLTGSGARTIPEESRRVETWGGYLCGDAHTVVAVNVTPTADRSLADSVEARTTLFRGVVLSRSIIVAGSVQAARRDGFAHGDSPADTQTLVMVFAIARDELVTLSVRSWPRDDVDREVERIVQSFEITRS